MNVELLLKVKEAILADPSRYDQETICASKCCIAGHAVAIAAPEAWRSFIELGTSIGGPLIAKKAKQLLGLSDARYERLCGYSSQWPKTFANKYEGSRNDRERAQIGAARIVHFIANASKR